MVGRYVYFKLLSTFYPYERSPLNSIDVLDLRVLGVALSKLPTLLQKYDLNSSEHPDPN